MSEGRIKRTSIQAHLDHERLTDDSLGSSDVHDSLLIDISRHCGEIETLVMISVTLCCAPETLLTVNVVPKPDALLEEFAAFAEREHHLCLTGGHNAIFPKEAVSSMKHRVKHRFVE